MRGDADFSESFEDALQCPTCGGDLRPLGVLGQLLWLRCRHCGMDVSQDLLQAVACGLIVEEPDPLDLEDLVPDPEAVPDDALYDLARREEEEWSET